MSNKGTILFIDDDPLNHDYYKKILESDGFVVVTAFDRAEANSIMDEQEFDIILIDLVLKNESGLDILEDIKKSSRLKYSIVVLISATLISSAQQAHGLNNGASGYITRPINKKEFVSRINAFMRHRELVLKLKKSEEKLLTIVENDPDGILVLDNGGKIKFANKSAENIFQLSVDTLMQNMFGYPVIAGENAEINIVRKDKNRIVAEMRTVNIEWNDENTLLTSIRDITDKKILWESLIKAKDKAQESDRLKSAFLTNMSHEIRTPMNGILGFTGLLKEPQLSGDEQNQYIQVIERSGKRMLNTINDIIDISKIEAGQVEVVNSEVSVSKILEEQYNFFWNETKSKGLKLIYEPLSPEDELRIITDEHKLEGILTNLIKNAIKYTDNGIITFGYSIKTLEEKNVVEFYVKDTGIGIPANRIDAIFNRFEQADIADKRAFQGSGLGLAISKSYVEMLGGKISVKSKEGEGSTFTFTIPYTKQLVKESDAIENINKEPQKSLSHLSLIIVEDDEVSRLFLQTILENKFNKITYTATGKGAIDKCRENPETDIILMDIRMPEMNGYDATREIRKFNKDVVIIAQTAFGLLGDREKALEAGCNDYISKPINKELLMEKIVACVNKRNI